MEIIGCDCSWDIPGVEKLPWHNHVPVQTVVNGVYGPDWDHPDAGINIWVDWKAVARSVECLGKPPSHEGDRQCPEESRKL